MFHNPSSGRRLAGRVIVLATVAVALPLTATRAIDYIDVPVASAPKAATAPVAAAAAAVGHAVQPAAAAQPAPPVAPVAPGHPVTPVNVQEDGRIMINGQVRTWQQLTPAEKAEVRRSIAHAKAELARTSIDREEIQREVREAMAEAKVDKDEIRRELAEARVEVDRALREIDAHAADIRRSGQDPEQIKATVRASLKAVEAIDVEAITRNAMASIDPAVIESSLAAAEAGLAKAEAAIERLEELDDEDDE